APLNPAFLIPTRDSLLSRLKDGSEDESWREFFETYWRLIYQGARNRGLNDHEAQDVVQETMVALTQRIGEFKRDKQNCSFKQWLMQLTNFKILAQLRKREPAERLDSKIEEGAEERFEADWERDWQVNAAEEAVRRVQVSSRPRMFQAYSLCVLQGRSRFVAAKLLKMSLPAVYMAIFKTRRKIRLEMEKLQKGQL
ncbi:MAG TPA: sigma-70 family RNA polymerase sigma factor, partial [Verrucomicrobiae bacterium]|nr:sigma-70 family RNA polymerase sigma factor [Verrucomicrobiae bacterium]